MCGERRPSIAVAALGREYEPCHLDVIGFEEADSRRLFAVEAWLFRETSVAGGVLNLDFGGCAIDAVRRSVLGDLGGTAGGLSSSEFVAFGSLFGASRFL